MEPQSQVKTRLIVIAAVGAAFMSGLDLFVVNVAFDEIGTAFGVGHAGGPTMADMSWVLNIYAVVFAALLVPFGRLADRYGRKNIFVGGLVLFVVASVACALSGGVWALVVFRALQAAGAAAMTPTSLAILMAALPDEKRVAGVRLWSATGAVAAAIGPTIGGVLTQISWQWVFLINLPVGVVLFWFAVRHVRESKHDVDATRPDLFGALLFAVAVGLLALGLVNSPDWGWVSVGTIGSLAGALVLTLLFVWRSSRHTSPVIDPALLKVRTFLWANISMLVFNLAFSINLLVGILWMQQVWGWSALLTGFAIAVGPAMVPLTIAFTNRVIPGVPPARLVALGALLLTVSTAIIASSVGTEQNYWIGFFPAWVLGGIGVGFATPSLMAGAVRGLPPAQTSTGTAIASMSRQIGAVLGISVLFAIVGDGQGPSAIDGYLTAWWAAAAIFFVTIFTALGMRTTATKVVAPAATR